MSKRREPRQQVRLPARIFGTDAAGEVFSEHVFAVDISRHGARVSGVHAQVKVGEIIGVTHGQNKGRFVVQWVGQPGTGNAGMLGLSSLTPEKNIWEVAMPASPIDVYRPKTTSGAFGAQSSGSERRQHPRLKCLNSVQLVPEGQTAPIWGKAIDLSIGGCFVEMSMPLPKGTRLKIAIWVREDKLWATGKVVSSRPGFGIGIQFTKISPQDAQQLAEFLKSITALRM